MSCIFHCRRRTTAGARGTAGSTAPDWLEWVANAIGKRVKHRSVTHYAAGWGIGTLVFALLWDFHNIGLAFFYGGSTHVLADALTVTGVPFAPNSDRRFHLFGGRLRTGGAGEYGIAGGCACVCGCRIATAYDDGLVPVFL